MRSRTKIAALSFAGLVMAIGGLSVPTHADGLGTVGSTDATPDMYLGSDPSNCIPDEGDARACHVVGTADTGGDAAGMAAAESSTINRDPETILLQSSAAPPQLVRQLAVIDISLKPATETSTMSTTDAISASRYFTPVIGKSSVDGAYLGRLTDHNYKGGSSSGAGTSSTNDGVLTNRAVWVVVFKGVSMPIFGPAGRHLPASYTTDLVVFTDAQTGVGLLAVTVPRE